MTMPSLQICRNSFLFHTLSYSIRYTCIIYSENTFHLCCDYFFLFLLLLIFGAKFNVFCSVRRHMNSAHKTTMPKEKGNKSSHLFQPLSDNNNERNGDEKYKNHNPSIRRIKPINWTRLKQNDGKSLSNRAHRIRYRRILNVLYPGTGKHYQCKWECDKRKKKKKEEKHWNLSP